MKMTTYRIVAEAPKKGREVYCVKCGKPYHCDPSDKISEITCCYCIMGLVDGMPEEMKKIREKRYMRLNNNL